MSEEKQAPPDIPIMQAIICDDCGESLFSVAIMYCQDAHIICKNCGTKFVLFSEKADELVTKTLLRGRDQKKLSSLLSIRLKAFQAQVGVCHEAAAGLFLDYIESLVPEMLEAVDGEILKHLQKLFFSNQDGSISDSTALMLEIELAAAETLTKAGYELIDENDIDEEMKY